MKYLENALYACNLTGMKQIDFHLNVMAVRAILMMPGRKIVKNTNLTYSVGHILPFPNRRKDTIPTEALMDNKVINLVKKLQDTSMQYHRLSCLFNELAHSIQIESKRKSWKEIKEFMSELDLDKIREVTISFKEFQK